MLGNKFVVAIALLLLSSESIEAHRIKVISRAHGDNDDDAPPAKTAGSDASTEAQQWAALMNADEKEVNKVGGDICGTSDYGGFSYC